MVINWLPGILISLRIIFSSFNSLDMNTKIIKLPEIPDLGNALKWRFRNVEPIFLLIALIVLLLIMPSLIPAEENNPVMINPNLLLLIVISLISFLIVSTLSWWLLQRFWMAVGLPDLQSMVSHFNKLPEWQQLSFFLFSFALLLYAALGCIDSIC